MDKKLYFQNNRGATLVELMVATAIMSLLALASLELNKSVIRAQLDVQISEDLKTFRQTIVYYLKSHKTGENFGECKAQVGVSSNYTANFGVETNDQSIDVQLKLSDLFTNVSPGVFRVGQTNIEVLEKKLIRNNNISDELHAAHIHIEYKVRGSESSLLKNVVSIPVIYKSSQQFGYEQAGCVVDVNESEDNLCESVGGQFRNSLDGGSGPTGEKTTVLSTCPQDHISFDVGFGGAHCVQFDHWGNLVSYAGSPHAVADIPVLVDVIGPITKGAEEACQAKPEDSCKGMGGAYDSSAKNCDFCISMGGDWVNSADGSRRVCSVINGAPAPTPAPPDDGTPKLAWQVEEEVYYNNTYSVADRLNALPSCEQVIGTNNVSGAINTNGTVECQEGNKSECRRNIVYADKKPNDNLYSTAPVQPFQIFVTVKDTARLVCVKL